MVSHHRLYFGGFVVTGVLLIGAILMGIVDGLSVLSGDVAYSGELVLLAILGEAAEWVAVVLVLGLFAATFLVATIVSVLRNASLPRDDRLVAIVERLERSYPLLRQFDVSEKVEPTAEDRRQRLKERYVAGEISEAAFEREMKRLMDENPSDETARSDEFTPVDTTDKS